jgi:long-chain fatty acid transport protein
MLKTASKARLVLLLATLAPSVSHAGALGRPNIFGAMGLGIGGAGFAGLANPSTIHFNPAGLTLMRETVVLGGLELVMAPRTYEPLDVGQSVPWCQSPPCPMEETKGGVIPAPSLGVSTRLAQKGGKNPLPVAFGLGFYNTFGGAMHWDESKVQPGITTSSILLLELVPAIAYQLTSKLSIGAGLRIGFGTFHLVNTERKGVTLAPSELSGGGVTAGFSAGISFQPLSWLRLGAVYASPMTNEMTGEGEVQLHPKPQPTRPDSVILTMPWPQWAALGVALTFARAKIYAGVRWTDWSAFHELVVDLSVINNVVEPIDFSDGVSTHLGTELAITDRITLRGGFSFDSNTVPDKSVERQYLDAPKFTAALGGGVQVWKSLALDVAYEILFGPPREVPDERTTEIDPATGQPEEVHLNAAPGSYSSMIHSIALSARYTY